jgi:hypothetical protein
MHVFLSIVGQSIKSPTLFIGVLFALCGCPHVFVNFLFFFVGCSHAFEPKITMAKKPKHQENNRKKVVYFALRLKDMSNVTFIQLNLL